MFADSFCQFMPIRIFASVTLKYWHLHTKFLVIFHLFPFIALHSCTCNTLILAVYELAGVNLAARDICKWSYFFNTFCWIIEMGIFSSSQLLIPRLELRCGCYALLTSYFVVFSFISKTTLLLPIFNSFTLFLFSLMRFSNSWMLLSNYSKDFAI